MFATLAVSDPSLRIGLVFLETGARLKFCYESECNTVPVVASPGISCEDIASALWGWIAAKQCGWATLR